MHALFVFLVASFFFCLVAAVLSSHTLHRINMFLKMRAEYVRRLEESSAQAVRKANLAMDRQEWLSSQLVHLQRKYDALELIYYWNNGKKMPPKNLMTSVDGRPN